MILLPVILILGTVYYTFDPGSISLFPKCPFLYITGYQCPGCGSQRALHALLHLNITEAWHYNKLLVLSIPYILLGAAFYLEPVKKRFPKTRQVLFGQTAIWVVFALVILFFIFRNL